jgi:hypothetical protein
VFQSLKLGHSASTNAQCNSPSLISQTIAHEHAFFCVPVIGTGINYNGRVLSTPADGGSIKKTERECERIPFAGLLDSLLA